MLQQPFNFRRNSMDKIVLVVAGCVFGYIFGGFIDELVDEDEK
jgi:hypothetical protein